MYRTVLSRSMYHTDHTDDAFNSLPAIFVSRNDPTWVCRRQYNEIYFHELFLAAHFSRKFEKPSDKVPTVHFLLCDDIVHFATATSLVHTSKIVLYSIYVIMYIRGNQLTQTTDDDDDDDDGQHTLNLETTAHTRHFRWGHFWGILTSNFFIHMRHPKTIAHTRVFLFCGTSPFC